ncbi:DUF559 domain-containing protein [Brevundimonas sp.]|uniref:endonuclease domain-containing protein n=1 Tax=Brevundimonas sp. TaxID=1871086 RepID=UPI0034568C4C
MVGGRISRARELRREQTAAERRLWSCLRDRGLGGYRWKRQVPIPPYYVDFLSPQIGLVIEVDGGQHSADTLRDARRTADLHARGLHVIRFWNYEIMEDLDAVCRTVLAACKRLDH